MSEARNSIGSEFSQSSHGRTTWLISSVRTFPQRRCRRLMNTIRLWSVIAITFCTSKILSHYQWQGRKRKKNRTKRKVIHVTVFTILPPNSGCLIMEKRKLMWKVLHTSNAFRIHDAIHMYISEGLVWGMQRQNRNLPVTFIILYNELVAK